MDKAKGLSLCLALVWGVVGLTAQTPQWLWASGAGGASGDAGQAIAVDSQGNQYVTGCFSGTATFGPYTLTSGGNWDVCVAKIDTAGNWLWAVRAGGTSDEEAYGIAVDEVGNAWLTGSFQDSTAFGPYTLISSGTPDIFAAKLDPNGNWLWAVRAGGGTSPDEGYGIDVDGTGNSYLTGYFQDTADFGAYTLTSNGGGDIFVAKLDPNGNWLWAVRAGGSNNDCGDGIAVDDAGNAYLSGNFQDTADFGPYTHTSSGYVDIFAAKLDANGSWLWAHRAGGAAYDYGHGIAVDGAGNAGLTGRLQGSAAFGPYTLVSSGQYDIFAAKLDPKGNWLWAVRAGGTQYDYGRGIAVDETGSTWLTGVFEGYASYGPHTLSSYTFFHRFADSLVKRMVNLLNWFKFPISNGISEGMNNALKELMRRSFGYKDFEYFRLKALQKMGYLNGSTHRF